MYCEFAAPEIDDRKMNFCSQPVESLWMPGRNFLLVVAAIDRAFVLKL